MENSKFKLVTSFNPDNFEASNISDKRIIKCKGRSGVNLTKLGDSIPLKGHTLNKPTGMLEMWVMSLEDLYISGYTPFAENEWMSFISDKKGNNDFQESHFSIAWKNEWGHPLFAKFYRGSNYPGGLFPRQKTFIEFDHIPVIKNTWYHFLLTWDQTKDEYCFYINGFLVGHSDIFQEKKLLRDKTGDILYIGHPCYCYSDINLYEGKIDNADEAKTLYLSSVIEQNKIIDKSIEKLQASFPKAKFRFTPDKSWDKALDLTLKEKSDLENFYVQGGTNFHRITDDGLEIKTPNYDPIGLPIPDGDYSQMYLWSNKSFEGNLFVEYEFMPLEHKGLSLLITQASGMQREDFMKEYPLRTDGAMYTIHSSNVRMYHWEYYREMPDARNDIASHGILKWPWKKPLAYNEGSKQIEINKWHKLAFLQQGTHIICSIDNEIIGDIEDKPSSNQGPTLLCGHIAIRCMIRTHMLFRNLKVYNQPEFEVVDQ